jgi:hypothetical protein
MLVLAQVRGDWALHIRMLPAVGPVSLVVAPVPATGARGLVVVVVAVVAVHLYMHLS